jgi:hypothetical protein
MSHMLSSIEFRLKQSQLKRQQRQIRTIINPVCRLTRLSNLRPIQHLHHLPNVERSHMQKLSATSSTPASFTDKRLRMAQLSRASSVALSRHRNRLARHCGIKYDDIITIRSPEPYMPPVYCVVAVTNLSRRSKIPRMDIIEKAKEFLGTTEEPKWYYIVRA